MREPPSQTLMWTFIFAVALKVLGVLIAMMTAYVTTRTWAYERWWMALVSGLFLLGYLSIWRQVQGRFSAEIAHWHLIGGLFMAIMMHQVDLYQSVHVPIELWLENPQFTALMGWSEQDANNVHALGALFTIVPVVLASWQYGLVGMLPALMLAGSLYVGAPLVVPQPTFNWWFYAVRGFVLLGVTLILATVVMMLAEAQRRKQRELAEANVKLAEQAVLMEQLATSRERNRLARELHDTLAHSLSGTAVQLQAVGTLMQVDVAAASAELRSAQSQIKAGLTEARRAISALRASPLEELGLVEAIRQRANIISERSGIPITTTMDSPPSLSQVVAQTLYRIVDEALVNAEKYSQASHIDIMLRVVGGGVVLTIADDGVGFEQGAVSDFGELRDTEKYGLRGMHERAQLIDGELNIASVLGHGTTIQLRVEHVN